MREKKGEKILKEWLKEKLIKSLSIAGYLTSLTSILFFICSGMCSREGPRDKCFGSSGGGGEKWAGRGGQKD